MLWDDERLTDWTAVQILRVLFSNQVAQLLRVKDGCGNLDRAGYVEVEVAESVGERLDLAEACPDRVVHHGILGRHRHAVLLGLRHQVKEWLLSGQVFEDGSGNCVLVGVVLVDALGVHLGKQPLLDVNVDQLSLITDRLEQGNLLCAHVLDVSLDALTVDDDALRASAVDCGEILDGLRH